MGSGVETGLGKHRAWVLSLIRMETSCIHLALGAVPLRGLSLLEASGESRVAQTLEAPYRGGSWGARADSEVWEGLTSASPSQAWPF